MTEISVPLHSRRRDRVQKVQKLQHIVPATGLLMDAMQVLSSGPSTGLGAGAGGLEQVVAIGEIVTTMLLVRSIVRALRPSKAVPSTKIGAARKADHGSHGIDWVDVCVAAVLAFEVWEHWRVTGHIRRPTVLMAVVTLAIGLLHGRLAARIERRRALRISDAGIRIGGRFFRKFFASWPEIARIDFSSTNVHIVLKSGRMRKIDLRDLHNAPDVRAAMQAAARRLTT